MGDYIGLCMHYDCTNRNSFGYCKTTACINQNYQHEQWISTSNRTDKVVVKPQTNADCIRSYSDEKIAGVVCTGCPPGKDFGQECTGDGACYDCWLDWLQSPADGGDWDEI